MNDCANDSCLNDGKCSDEINNYTCQCHPGFTGRNCEININECLSDPCQFGGNCVDGISDYLCKCPHGRTGECCWHLLCLTCFCSREWQHCLLQSSL